jgi:hypothetical protein
MMQPTLMQASSSNWPWHQLLQAAGHDMATTAFKTDATHTRATQPI